MLKRKKPGERKTNGSLIKELDAAIALLHGRMIRQSLDVRSWEAAQRIVRSWEVHAIGKSVSLPDAYDRYLENH